MRTLNELNVLGHVGNNPKLFGQVAKLSVATNRVWTDQSGSRQEATDWVPVTILDSKQAEWVAKNVKKGDRVFAKCRVAETSYERDGERIYTVDVVALMFNLLASKSPNEGERNGSSDDRG